MRTSLIKMIIGCVIAFTVSSCNQTKLSNEEAKSLVVNSLNLPISINAYVSYRGKSGFLKEFSMDILKREGYIMDVGDWLFSTTQVTNKGREYLVNTEDINGSPEFTFRMYDIDFEAIKGIAINKEQQTATVRFALKYTNITPVAEAIDENIQKPLESELVFKKFDSGWQLQSDQNKTPRELVNDILKSNKN